MGKVIVDLSVSLDGFIAGANDGLELPLGQGGEALFAWMRGDGGTSAGEWGTPEASRVVVEEWTSQAGAMISGRRTFDIAGGWAGGHPIDAPIFVLTHEAPTNGKWSPRLEFVTEGLDRALELAQEAAGDKFVSVCGADIAQQLLKRGQVDEIQVSIAPVLLGSGVRLFDGIDAPITLEQVRVIGSTNVAHLRYRVVH
jgi:dihydrofolate reductase